MHSTSHRLSLAALLFAACSSAAISPPVVAAPASMPASRPAVLYQPVNPKDPTQGYFVSYAAAQTIEADKIRVQQENDVRVLGLQKQIKLQGDEAAVNQRTAWDVWVKPVLVGTAALIFGAAVGAGIEAAETAKH